MFLRVGPGEFAKAVLGTTTFALGPGDWTIDGGETWMPLWTLRQNIYTDPQKPLQMDPGVYPIGEPDATLAAARHHQLLADLLHRLDRARRRPASRAIWRSSTPRA